MMRYVPVGGGVPDPRLMPEVVLNAILVGPGFRAVIPPMMHRKHLESNCRAVMEGRFTAGEDWGVGAGAGELIVGDNC
jgi:hypothetical protein